jgi:tetratricopeptide (TPR) repeat protein
MQSKYLNLFSGGCQKALLVTIFLIFATRPGILFAQSANNNPTADEIRIEELQGIVEISAAGAATWTAALTNQVLHPLDRLRTGENSRVALRWSDQSIVPFGASTELEILPPNSPDAQSGLHLIRGIISFFHRDKPGRIQIITRGAVAGVEGTEFVMSVNDADVTTLSLVDGKVKFGNEQAALILTNGEEAIAAPGSAPTRTAGFIANNLLQWCFYYPAVIDPDELLLSAAEQNNLADSLAAYRSGDLPLALEKYPARRANISDNERIYAAALLLSVGEVDKAETTLSAISGNDERPRQLAAALRQLIAAVKRQPVVVSTNFQLASELLAQSYCEQSRAIRETSLRNALNLAKQAVKISPKFGFAKERVAELEFSFGDTKNALADLDQSLALAPRNAQALALKGFLIAAQNQSREAINWFDQALAADPALGNAWLGRGLCRIHVGDANGGREDLLVAAALEPQRAELRSYLGKAYANVGDFSRATKELQLAKKLDTNDPTAWIYSALLNQEDNLVNDAIRDLEKSQSLNDNRSVYRSQLLLDQDSAVRSANLAGMYKDAGMFDVSLREAGRAVSADYANYSAHLFLANSYEQLRDPDWNNLRYDTPAVSEFWIANLLAPTGAGWLSSSISEQPYARMFQENHFGGDSDTTYLSRDAWTETADLYYTSDKFSFDVGTSYLYDPGQRPNDDFESREFDVNLKWQLSSRDSVFATVQLAKIISGDNNVYYSQSYGSRDFRESETQVPNLYLGYHHEWSPGVHTLFFANRQVADESANTSHVAQHIAGFSGETFTFVDLFVNREMVKLSPDLYSTELQQIWEQANHTTIIGSRFDWGNVRYTNAESEFDGAQVDVSEFPQINPFITQNFKLDFDHFDIYGYHNWQIADSFALNVGLTYDYLRQPADVGTTPFATEEKTTTQISPKIGLIWTVGRNTTFRAAYARSLSDFAGEQSYRLEPTEIAGFNQAFRSLIPESVVGDTSGSKFDTFDFSLEQKFDTETYVGLSGEIFYSKLHELEGAFVSMLDTTSNFFTFPLGLNKSLDYRERSLTFTVDQLLGKQWTAGARYRVSQANLDVNYVDVPNNLAPDPYYAPFQPRQSHQSVLHTVNLHANWNHPSGLFSILEGNWYHQNNSGFSPAEPGDDFWQFNAYAGCRFWHRRAEFMVGLLNITGQNYQLEPLNLYNEMARSRTLLARLKFSF